MTTIESLQQALNTRISVKEAIEYLYAQAGKDVYCGRFCNYPNLLKKLSTHLDGNNLGKSLSRFERTGIVDEILVSFYIPFLLDSDDITIFEGYSHKITLDSLTKRYDDTSSFSDLLSVSIISSLLTADNATILDTSDHILVPDNFPERPDISNISDSLLIGIIDRSVGIDNVSISDSIICELTPKSTGE